MLFGIVYPAARALLGLLVRGGHLAVADIELLLLRHEARVARRARGRGAWRPADRLVLAALSRCLPPRDWHVFPVHPATLRRWHRELLQRKRRADGRRRGPGRPPLAPALRALIERLARENARWGYRRIRGELLKPGHDASATAIRTTLRRRGVPPAPRRAALSWPVFLRAQAAGVLAGAAPVAEVLWGHALALNRLVGACVARVSAAGGPSAAGHRRSVSRVPGAPPPDSCLSPAWSALDRRGATRHAGSAHVPSVPGQPAHGGGGARLSPSRRPRYPPRVASVGGDGSSVHRARCRRAAETALRPAA